MTTHLEPDLPPNPTRHRTTRPVFPLAQDRKTLETRINDNLSLQLRPFFPTDLPHVHRLRTQTAVMINTSTGRIDADLSVSETWMARYMPPNDATTFDLMIWVKETNVGEHADTAPVWEHIGVLGCHINTPVPHIGYMLRTEWWGKGIATHALKAFLSLWWSLPRRDVVIDSSGVDDKHELHLMKLEWDQDENEKLWDPSTQNEVKVVPEILLAEIEERNFGSLKVIERCGFMYRAKEKVIDDNGECILLDYTATRPAAS